MLRVIERCNVRILGWFLVGAQDSELWVTQDFARIVDIRVCGDGWSRHFEEYDGCL